MSICAASGNSAPRQRRGRNVELRVVLDVERQDRAVGRQIIGGAAGRGGDEDAVADQFAQPRRAVHGDLQLRRLVDLAEQ